MAFSIAEILILCLLADWIFRRLRLPGLIGMLLVGILLGPHAINAMAPSLMAVSPDLRLIALIVILLRSGLKLTRETLHGNGGRVLLLAFVPALFEMGAITCLAPRFLDLSYREAALLGTILAAVSPAVVVPAMIKLMDHNRGADKGIPAMIMAAASIDDVFVIVAHSIALSLYLGHSTASPLRQFATIPVSLLGGSAMGLLSGIAIYKLCDHFNPRATKRVLILIASATLLIRLQDLLEGIVPFSGLVATMAVGFIILEKREQMAHELSAKLAKIWIFAEIILFSLVGAQVDIGVAWQAGLAGLAILAGGLVARSGGVALCLLHSNLNRKERLFVILAYAPKATVQAAIGASPLLAMQASGLPTAAGETILALAVLSIIITAPLGALAIQFAAPRCLAPESDRTLQT
ncbi:MAG: cation:proton antiporter [Kiritimatiellia bacterium]